MTAKYSRSTSLLACLIILSSVITAQNSAPVATQVVPFEQHSVLSVKPEFIPPSQVLEILGARQLGGCNVIDWKTKGIYHIVEIRYNAPANLLILSGVEGDVAFVADLIRQADIPPRQIEIEVKIVEINTSKAHEIGLDWERIWKDAAPRVNLRYRESHDDNARQSFNTAGIEASTYDERRDIDRYYDVTSTVDLGSSLDILDESGAVEIHNAPKILTLNNRRATILDGDRVTYVTRYSSYTNLFETDSMDAGLTMSVLPSMGESGYITLELNAEFTNISGNISGSPIKSGQLIENTIIVKDGESVLLGGLSRTIKDKHTKRFPILGHILPFLFSHESMVEENIESFMILTTRVVDFNTALKTDSVNSVEGK
ncbi:MAG: hypothetical protein GY841_23670 [FCB group bacterium]|nr:hypothetical protein [FCB group bacterium]